jgi:hypothetical protein
VPASSLFKTRPKNLSIATMPTPEALGDASGARDNPSSG